MQTLLGKAPWINHPDIRPYVFVRPENQIPNSGSRHSLDWFTQAPVIKDALDITELAFADRIYSLEERAFGPSNMAMPRWVFYDCAVMPGFVAGFAARPSALSKEVRAVLDPKKFPATDSPIFKSSVLKPIESLDEMDWVPLSLFIIIPSMHRGEWMAHNLCSVNSLVSKEQQYYGLGFLSKAFGLWYANVQQCSGVTQWGSPALRLHSSYGHLEVVGAYAPVHSHAKTITYRVQVDTSCWEKFFTKEQDFSFLEKYSKTEDTIDPQDEESMVHLQQRIERGEGPFFLDAAEISKKDLKEKLTLFKPKLLT